MSALPAPAVPELRALLLFADLPANCIAAPVTNAGLAPHLRPGEFAIVDTTDREPVNGELYLVAWMGALDTDGHEQRALCQAHWRGDAWSVGSLRRPWTREEVTRLIRSGRLDELGWSNGPYRDGVLERQIRGRVIGLLAPAFEEPRRLPAIGGGCS